MNSRWACSSAAVVGLLACSLAVDELSASTDNCPAILLETIFPENVNSPYEEFGKRMASFGDTLIVGVPFENGDCLPAPCSAAGAVCVFQQIEGSWTEVQRLLLPDPEASDYFGIGVAIHEDVIVVGALGRDGPSGSAGAAFVYRYNGVEWLLEETLVPRGIEEGDSFGAAVTVGPNLIAVGAPRDDHACPPSNSNCNSGSVWIYKYDESSRSWALDGQIWSPTPTPGHWFGNILEIDAQSVWVGVTEVSIGSGAVYVFERPSNEWQLISTLMASDPHFYDYFGTCIAVKGDEAFIGAPGANDNRGAVFAFRREGATWVSDGQIESFDGTTEDRFGTSIAISDEFLLVGAPDDVPICSCEECNRGAAYVFRRTGDSWHEQGKLAVDLWSWPSVGTSVELVGGIAMAAAPGLGPVGGMMAFDVTPCDTLPAVVLHVPSDVATIQEAIDMAGHGSEIIVGPGTYSENIDFRGKSLTLRSSEGPSQTILDGSGTMYSSVIRCTSREGSDTLVQGFTVTGGTGQPWCEFYVSAPDTTFGGGIFLFESSPTIKDCVFISNTARFGGGICARGTGDVSCQPVIVNCTFIENTADSHLFVAEGGAISFLVASGIVEGCLFLQNSAGDDPYGGGGRGGAIASEYEGEALSVKKCAFAGNSCHGPGGAIYATMNALTLTDCQFVSNWTWSDIMIEEAGAGGAVVAWNGVVAERCTFISNTSNWLGGALHVGSSSLKDCTFIDNEAAVGGGAIIGGNATVVNCLFQKNRAVGISQLNASGRAGALQGAFSGTCTMVNCTVVDNHASIAPKEPALYGGVDRFDTITNSIVWGNSDSSGQTLTAQVSAGTVVTSSCIQGSGSAAPMFVRSDYDFHLAPGSPYIDAGNNGAVPTGIVVDLDGRPRFADDPSAPDTGSGSGPKVDLGAYEHRHACSGDVFPSPIGDESVNIDDLLIIIQHWGRTDIPGMIDGDTNGDGTVNIDDLLEVIGDWGACT